MDCRGFNFLCSILSDPLRFAFQFRDVLLTYVETIVLQIRGVFNFNDYSSHFHDSHLVLLQTFVVVFKSFFPNGSYILYFLNVYFIVSSRLFNHL